MAGKLIPTRCRGYTSKADRDDAIRREKTQYKGATTTETHDHSVTVEGIEFGLYILIVRSNYSY